MTPKRAFFAMIGLIVVSVGSIVGILVVGNGMLQSESTKLVDLKIESAIAEKQQTDLAKAKSDINKYSSLDEITQTIVPQDKDQARAIREIVAIAGQSGIGLESFTFASSSLGNKTPAANEEKKATASVSQAKPVDGIKGVYSIELNIRPSSQVRYSQFIDFLARLEKNRRTSQVSQIEIKPNDPTKNTQTISFSLNVNIFVKP